MGEAVEGFIVQEPVAQSAVDALDESVLRRLAWRNAMPEDACLVLPFEHRAGSEPGSVVADVGLRLKKTGPGAFVPEYTHFDSQGSAVAATNAGGTVTWRERVRAAAAAFSACNRSTGAIAAPCGAPAPKPFGEELLNPAANADNTAYTGHLKDDATGLNYMQARYYDPIIGRFLSTDPIGYQDQLNL